MRTKRLTQSKLKTFLPWLILTLLLVLVIAAESVAMRIIFTSKYPGANDFFVRWLGGRVYLLEGTNPFDQSVAEQAQKAMFGRLARPEDKDQAYFAYPLYTLYFFWPLSLVSYDWAQAIWMTLLQFMLLGSTGLAIWLSCWRPGKWLLVFTLLWSIFFYNGARAILLGQFSILVGLALFAGLWAIERRRDGWAGIFLAITTIKPQMVFLVLLFVFIWALFQGRWRLLLSFGLTMLGLVLSSILLVPTWPLDFVNNAVAYSDYVAFGTPLENLLGYFLPGSLVGPLYIILSALFFVALLPGWWLAFRGQPGAYTWTIHLTLIVGSLITFRSATTNQVILYLPIFFFFYRLQGRRPSPTTASPSSIPPKEGEVLLPLPMGEGWGEGCYILLIILCQISLFSLMWSVFIATLAGNWEDVMMHGLLPALMLLLYALDWRGLWAAARQLEMTLPTHQPKIKSILVRSVEQAT